MIAVDVPCPLRILYIVNCAKTRSTSLARDPLESHESRLPIVSYYFAYSGQNKSLKVAQIGKHYFPILYLRPRLRYILSTKETFSEQIFDLSWRKFVENLLSEILSLYRTFSNDSVI